MSTPKQEKNWKGSMSRLFTCGSGKKSKKEEKKNAPTLKSENQFSLDDTDGNIN